MVERGHDPLGDLTIALVEEGLAAREYVGRGRLVDVLAPVGRRDPVRFVREVSGYGLLELLEGVDGLFSLC